MGKSIYFSNLELDALNDLRNSLDDICVDEDTYAYWLKRTGTAFYKINEALSSKKVTNKSLLKTSE